MKHSGQLASYEGEFLILSTRRQCDLLNTLQRVITKDYRPSVNINVARFPVYKNCVCHYQYSVDKII